MCRCRQLPGAINHAEIAAHVLVARFVRGVPLGGPVAVQEIRHEHWRPWVHQFSRHGPDFYRAVIIYAATTVLYLWILTRIPLSAAYPLVAGAKVVVPLSGSLFFGEQLTGHFWLGAALIVIGMFVIRPVD